MPSMNENSQQNEGVSKQKGRENGECAKYRGAKAKGGKFNSNKVVYGCFQI